MITQQDQIATQQNSGELSNHDLEMVVSGKGVALMGPALGNALGQGVGRLGQGVATAPLAGLASLFGGRI